MARSVWRKTLGRGASTFVRSEEVGIQRFAPSHGLQRRALRTAWHAPSSPFGGDATRDRHNERHLEPTDHFPRRPAGRTSRDASGRLSRGHHQLLGSHRRQRSARSTENALRNKLICAYRLVLRRVKPAKRLSTKSTSAITNRICAIPAAVEAMPPKPNTAATSATKRNIRAQYSIAYSR